MKFLKLQFLFLNLFLIMIITCTEDPAGPDINSDILPKGSISGYVSDMWNQPIKDVLISVNADSAVPGVSDAAGQFTVGNVKAGTYVLRFTHGDYEDNPTCTVTVEQGVDDTLSDTVYLSYKYFILKGRVLSNGQPVGFAGVVIDNLLLSTLTNGAGLYVFDKVRQEAELKLIFAKNDVGWYDLSGIKGNKDDTTYIPDVTLVYKGATVTGTVFDTLNNPAPNAQVYSVGSGLLDTTDAQGIYVLKNVPFHADNIPIYAYKNGFIGATSGICIDTNSFLTGIDIYLRKASDFVNGIKLEVSDIIVEDTATTVTLHVLALTDGTVFITEFEWFYKNMTQPVTTSPVPYVTISLDSMKAILSSTDTSFKAAVRVKADSALYSEKKEFYIKIIGTEPSINASVSCHPDSAWGDTATITASQSAYFHCSAIVMFGGIDTLEWNFGDSTQKLVWTDSLPVFGHTYTTPGNYTAICRVKSTFGKEVKDSVIVIVNPSAIDTPVYISPINGDTVWQGSDSITLLWHNVAGTNITYDVYLDSLNTIPVVKVASAITDTFFTVAAKKDVRYYWAVEAVSGSNSAMGSPYFFIRKEIINNNAPQFTSQPQDMTDTAKVGREYKDTVHAADIDGDTIDFNRLEGPTDFQVVDSIVTWTPSINDTGPQPVSVRASDGKGGLDTLSWTITVKDTGGSVSSNVYLSSLILSHGTLTPPFDTGTTVYTSWVNNTIASITVTPTAQDSMATITVNNDTVQSGNASKSISLQVGENQIEIDVIAEDKVTKKTYIVIVTREIDVTVLDGMYVTGIDTIKKENSPYFVTSGILVANGGTLLIEPGVKLLMDSAIAIDVQGTLIARGTALDSIVFSAYSSLKHWGYLLFSDSAIDATFDTDTNYTDGCILEYCVIEFAGNSNKDGAIVTEEASPYIAQCSIRCNSNSGLYLTNRDYLRIENNVIYDNVARMGGGICIDQNFETIVIKRCIIQNNIVNSFYGGGICHRSGSSNPAFIDSCIISGNKSTSSYGGGGIYCNTGDMIITHTLITENEASNYSAFKMGNTVISLEYNTITKNKCTDSSGITSTIYVPSLTQSYPFSAVHNNILNNTADYDFYNDNPQGSNNLNATNNYWGTTDENEIKDKIYDWFDDNSLGIVDYSPWLTEPEPDAPQIPPR